MAFVISFVLLALALPLIIEVHKKGSDNILTRSGKEMIESKILVSTISKIKIGFGSFLIFAFGGAAVIVIITAIWVLFRTSAGEAPFILTIPYRDFSEYACRLAGDTS
jgi:hypothetical protein